jgi:hypothetical protein
MYHPEGFIDSNNYIIKGNNYLITGNKAFYYVEGDSYYAKFMNSLSLEDKFKNDDIHEERIRLSQYNYKKNTEKDYSGKTIKKINYNDEYKYDYKFENDRKGKSACKIRRNKRKFMKKNKIRQQGYSQKIFYQSEYTIKPDELISNLDIEIETFEEEYARIEKEYTRMEKEALLLYNNRNNFHDDSYDSDSDDSHDAKIERMLSKIKRIEREDSIDSYVEFAIKRRLMEDNDKYFHPYYY